MVNDWQVMNFDDAIAVNPARVLAKGEVAPFIAMEDLMPFQRRIEAMQSKEYKGSGSRFTQGDTLLARITPCLENGKTAFISNMPEGIVGHGSTEFIVLSRKEGLTDNLFVYYLARDPNFRSFAIQKMEGTSGRQRVPAIALLKLRVNLPPLPEQHAIAAILGALDDKIELNRQMNKTLEAMAQALFKSWFVDFEPFRDGGMQDSPLGVIPRGWRAGTLGEICDIVMGQSPPGETYNELGNGTPFYQGIRDFGFRFPSRRVFCTAPTRFAQKGDVLLSVRAPVGSLNMAIERCTVGRGVAALRLKSHVGSFPYYLLKSAPSSWEKFEAEGTVFGAVTKADVHGFETILPPLNIVGQFNQIVEPLDAKIELNDRESHTLAAIRDTLLPKLLSGEIRVKDAFVIGSMLCI